MNAECIKRKPFYLDDTAVAWVEATFASLTQQQKLGQLLLPMARDLSPAALGNLLRFEPGGIFRFSGIPTEVLRQSGAYLQTHSHIPLLMAGDLEFGEGSAIGQSGTQLPNPLAII